MGLNGVLGNDDQGSGWIVTTRKGSDLRLLRLVMGYTEVIRQNPFLLLLVADLVVMLEQVLAKVAAEVAPHGMDVVGVVLCVV